MAKSLKSSNILRHFRESREPFGSGDNVTVEAGARMDYASNVEARGRSNVTALLDQAAVELDYRFDSDAMKIGGM